MGEIWVSGQFSQRPIVTYVVVQNPPAPPPCTYTASANPQALPAISGAGTLTIGADRPDCSWSVAKTEAYVQLTSNTVGQGAATVSFTATDNVVPNQSTPARSITLTVSGPNPAKVLNLTQAGLTCKFVLSAIPAILPKAGIAAGTPLVITVSAATDCQWTATGMPAWVHVVGNAAGKGGETLTLTIDANQGAARTATPTVAGLTVTLKQEAADAPYSVSGSITVDGKAAAGVQVTFYEKGAGAVSNTRTDSAGKFSQGGFKDGKMYVAVPTLAGAGFVPDLLEFGAATNSLNFTAFLAYNASGTVSSKGKGLPNVKLTFAPATAGKKSFDATTDANGNWARTLEAGMEYTVTPELAGYSFNPKTRTVKPQSPKADFQAK
jgi:hypothetical protein